MSPAPPAKVRGIYERDKGSGVWWVRWADGLGRIRRQKVGPKPLAIAVYHKRKAEAREAGLFPEVYRRGIKFAELCDDFKKAKPDHWSYKTGNAILARLRKWFESTPAGLITPQLIEERLNSLIVEGRSPATANRYRSVASAIFNWGIRNQKVTANPVRAVTLRRENNHRLRFLESEEESRLRQSIRALAPDREAEFTLALHTGMRQGEQYALKWDDVDVNRGFIRLLKTKSGRPRTIPLNTDARAAILDLRRFHQSSNLVCARHPRPWFERCLTQAKIAGFRWHDLRHTFASRLVMSGVDLATVQDLLGHQTVAMTLRYAHLSDDHKAAAVEKLTAAPQLPHVPAVAAEAKPYLLARRAK